MKNKFNFKCNVTLILMIVLNTVTLLGQSVNSINLNSYKYLVVTGITGKNTSETRRFLVKNLQKAGYNVINLAEPLRTHYSLPEDLEANKNLALYMTIEVNVGFSYTTIFSLFNYQDQLVLQRSGSAGLLSSAVKNSISSLTSYNYSYSPNITIEDFQVEKSNDTEEMLMDYFKGNNLDEIEGIYKSYRSVSMPYYKLGIKKDGLKYKAVILETESNSLWKVGEIKAVFENSSINGIYSVKWFTANKTSFETFGTLDNKAVISIEFINPNTGEKGVSKFIKLYPQLDFEMAEDDIVESSGSGFFITTDGIIATNAHVVDNAKSIMIQISNDEGQFEYTAKILLKDNSNDVALLKIDDENFKGLPMIPYSFNKKVEIGEKSFTIGYPLNNIMGANYKVTDGIISSNSGINDDVRYYQISVPLQPGNSGGPLFNKEGEVIGITAAQLDSKNLGTHIENVNYAIKISYLLKLYSMLPDSEQLKTTTIPSDKELKDHVKILKNYVCLISVNSSI